MMSFHKLSAGSGYTYLTRQVAVGDSTERGFSSLADYYSVKGEAPGRWAGGGLASLGVTGQVTEQQMLNLFGEGLHPDADVIAARVVDAGGTVKEAADAGKLGRKFPVFEGGEGWRDHLAARYVAYNVEHGFAENKAVPEEAKKQIRTDLANAMFAQKYGRSASGDQELSGFLAQVSRPDSSAVAGFDATFSPVKSISTLWALAPREVSENIEAAHHAAVDRTMAWLETEAGYTRTGAGGVAQVEIKGLIQAMFTHRDSRAGDPDLHTHVAISNKVETLDGRWLALDARMIHRLIVAASEHYNTVMEAEFVARVGGRFEERQTGPGKRPIREVAGVDAMLNERFSSRRQAIDVHRAELATTFQAQHGRLPTTIEMVSLAQQATLATREAKHEPRSLAEQRALWRAQALEVLGGPEALEAMIVAVAAEQVSDPVPITRALMTELTLFTVDAVMASRAQWRESNLLAEAFRQVRGAGVAPAEMIGLALRITGLAAGPEHSVPIGMDTEITAAPTPQALLRRDGTSQFRVAKAQQYTSPQILDAETRIVGAAGRHGARALTAADVGMALLEWSANNQGRTLNAGQLAMVTSVATSSFYLQLVMAPAGSGKTTAMGALARAHISVGGSVLGLAPQASAAQELAAAIPGVQADTLDKLVWEITHEPTDNWPDWVQAIGSDTLVIIDEAGLAGTLKLDAAVAFITGRGGKVLLVGDDQQRAAAGAGGVLRDIDAAHGSLTLSQVMRFQDRGVAGEGRLQGDASLALRAGDPGCAGFYADRGRIRAATPDTAIDLVYTAWKTDIAAGADSVMIAPDLTMVAALNARARTDRLAAAAAGTAPGLAVDLPNGEVVSAGDVILTKKNQRTLSLGGTDFVKNNHRWHVDQVNPDGSVLATELTRGITRVLPAWYLLAGDARLGYAHTTASVQGLTVGSAAVRGTAHAIITTSMSRNDAYPAMTRGTDANTAWMIIGGAGEGHDIIKPDAIRPDTVIEAFTKVITTDGSARSATTEIREAEDPALRLGRPGSAADAYAHTVVVACQALIGPDEVARIVAAADLAVPGITTSPAWDTIRGHLIVLAANGKDPIAELAAAAGSRELGTADDMAAVLDWRLDETGNHSLGVGPLPWLPALPQILRDTPQWGPYLAARSALVTDLADQLRDQARTWTADTAPAWAVPYLPDPQLVADLAVWRAAQSVPTQDLRPAGEWPGRLTLRGYHEKFTDRAVRVAGDPTGGAARWAQLIAAHGVTLTADDYWPVLAARLSLAQSAGLDVPQLLTQALTGPPLPAEAAASALWFRLSADLGSITAGPGPAGHHTQPGWSQHLPAVLGQDITERIISDPLWPTLVAHVEQAERRGVPVADVIPAAAEMLRPQLGTIDDRDVATSLLWHISTLAGPAPDDTEPPYADPMDFQTAAAADAHTLPEQATHQPGAVGDYDVHGAEFNPRHPAERGGLPMEPADLEPVDLEPAAAALASTRAPGQDTDTDPAVLARLYEVNATAHTFYLNQAPGSWVPGYVTARGLDPADIGSAPNEFHALYHALRQQGFADTELLAAGLVKHTQHGDLIDRYRDRAMLPYYTPAGDIAGFTGRLSPEHQHFNADRPDPKYLNGPETPIFSKRELPFGLTPEVVAAIRAGGDIALVEGPFDAYAITTAAHSQGRNLVGVAANGTALAADQLAALDQISPLADRRIIEAFDADPAGRAAAFTAHATLAAAGIHTATQTTGLTEKDPAGMLTDHGPAALLAALDQQRPLADHIVDTRIGLHHTEDGFAESKIGALHDTARWIAAMPLTEQHRQAGRIADQLHIDPFRILDALDAAAPIRTPAPNPLPDTGELHLPTPPVLTAPRTLQIDDRLQQRMNKMAARLRQSHAPALTAEHDSTDALLQQIAERLDHQQDTTRGADPDVDIDRDADYGYELGD